MFLPPFMAQLTTMEVPEILKKLQESIELYGKQGKEVKECKEIAGHLKIARGLMMVLAIRFDKESLKEE